MCINFVFCFLLWCSNLLNSNFYSSRFLIFFSFVFCSSIGWFYWKIKKGTVPQFTYVIYNTLQLIWVFFCTMLHNHTVFSINLFRLTFFPNPPSQFLAINYINSSYNGTRNFVIHISLHGQYKRIWYLRSMHFSYEVFVCCVGAI